ncbi:MAG: hypothetical protein IT539_03950 [Bradyrhizobiaceae bacterium]|nr:hypothetical protein [Bradyrhizobiaceae bacterium]
MGTVLRFPAERVRGTLYGAIRPEPAAVVILPVVRIEREAERGEGPGAAGIDTPPRTGNARRRRAPRA